MQLFTLKTIFFIMPSDIVYSAQKRSANCMFETHLVQKINKNRFRQSYRY